MKTGYIVGFLVLIVLAIFIFKPDMLGTGDAPTFVFVPTDTMQAYVTDIACDNTQVCIDRAISEGTALEDINANCKASVCVYYIEGLPAEASQ